MSSDNTKNAVDSYSPTNTKKSRKSFMKRNVNKLAVGVLASSFLLGGVSIAQAADTTPMDSNPGYEADFSWKGFNWEKRFWGGAPHYNGSWSADNVSDPDSNGYVKLSLTNPSGNSPVAAEFQSTRRGFGYGTYSTVVEKNISTMQKEVVWGCLFTYDPDAKPGHSEIDLCEASAWGGGAGYGQSWPIVQGHGYWFDATKTNGDGNTVVNFPAPNYEILTHKMIWEPKKITFETYGGEGYDGPLLKRTVLEGDAVPVPAKERIHFNLWVTGGGGGNPDQVKPESVTIRDFSFTPSSGTPIEVSPITEPEPVVEPSPAPVTEQPSTKPTKAPKAPKGKVLR